MIAFALGGYAVLMVLASCGCSWSTPGSPSETGYAIAALTLLTGFIAWIAARTTLLAVRGRLFPAS